MSQQGKGCDGCDHCVATDLGFTRDKPKQKKSTIYYCTRFEQETFAHNNCEWWIPAPKPKIHPHLV